ncbi:MAG: hypothetical protein HYV07_07280 [Deltaproteobacteria bacterium]|nr:hypothetical protein [Deltaproteobacteria bacterium]
MNSAAGRPRAPWIALGGGLATLLIAILGANVEATLFALFATAIWIAGALGTLIQRLTRRTNRSLAQSSVGIVIWVFVMASSALLTKMRDLTALSRAHDLRIAVSAYRSKKGRYPDRLEQLLPEYLIKLPLSKDTFLKRHEFEYLRVDCAERCPRGCDSFGCLEDAGTSTRATTEAAGIRFFHGVLDQTTLDVARGVARQVAF